MGYRMKLMLQFCCFHDLNAKKFHNFGLMQAHNVPPIRKRHLVVEIAQEA